MKQMEFENRRLLQEEADRKNAERVQKSQSEHSYSTQNDNNKDKAEADLQAEAKNALEQQTKHDKELQAEADHQRELDTAADLKQKADLAKSNGTELALQQTVKAGIGQELEVHKPGVYGEEKQNLSWRPGTSMEQRPDDPTYLKSREAVQAELNKQNLAKEEKQKDQEMEM